MKLAVNGIPAKYVAYMGIVWAERRNSTHTLPITLQLWAVFLKSINFVSVLRSFLFRVQLLLQTYYTNSFDHSPKPMNGHRPM